MPQGPQYLHHSVSLLCFRSTHHYLSQYYYYVSDLHHESGTTASPVTDMSEDSRLLPDRKSHHDAWLCQKAHNIFIIIYLSITILFQIYTMKVARLCHLLLIRLKIFVCCSTTTLTMMLGHATRTTIPSSFSITIVFQIYISLFISVLLLCFRSTP